MRRVHVEENGDIRAIVYWCNEWQEFVVRLIEHDEYMPTAFDYFTDDKQDAIDTAKVMVAARVKSNANKV